MITKVIYSFSILSVLLMGSSVYADNTSSPADKSAKPQSLRFVKEKSSFAIITGREGLASGLAHRHVILAQDPTVTLTTTSNPDNEKAAALPLIGGSADIKIAVKTLLVDDVNATEFIRALAAERGIWSASADRVDSSIREKVTENMLDSSQLNAAHFPTIAGTGSFSDCQIANAQSSKCKLALAVTIRGVTVSKEVELQLVKDASGIFGQFVAPFKFNEFGIKPYSAMLGAIRVSDEFHLAAILRTE